MSGSGEDRSGARAERRAGRPPKDNRNFVEAVLWWRRTGVPWRDPGKPCSIDSTGAANQGIGRSRGGLSTKVHVVFDALGLPLTFEITEGQRHDNRPAKELSRGCSLYVSSPTRRTTRMLSEPRSLSRTACRSFFQRQPQRRKLPYDKERYKERSEIECTFNLLEQARRFATRYEKTLRNYAAVVAHRLALCCGSESRRRRCPQAPWLRSSFASLMSIDTTRTSVALPSDARLLQ